MEGLEVTLAHWSGRRVLVTGHTGFKGAWLCLWLEHLGAQVIGMALPPEDPAGAYNALSPWDHLESLVVDLRDRTEVIRAVTAAEPDVIFHLGAQAFVRRGYADPSLTWAVNVLGTAHVLDAARTSPSVQSIVVVTSDKVYANSGDSRPFREDDRLGGEDPYSSSKAAAELVAESWRFSYFAKSGPPLATARAGNVIGGGDRGEDRLLPDVWRALEADAPVLLRYPKATRPWQFVLEPLLGYLLLGDRLIMSPITTPLAVNFGPRVSDCVPVAEVVERVLALWGGGRWQAVEGEQPPEATALTIDAGLAAERLQWRPKLTLDVALEWTVDWWRSATKGADLRKFALSQISAYEELAAHG